MIKTSPENVDNLKDIYAFEQNPINDVSDPAIRRIRKRNQHLKQYLARVLIRQGLKPESIESILNIRFSQGDEEQITHFEGKDNK